MFGTRKNKDGEPPQNPAPGQPSPAVPAGAEGPAEQPLETDADFAAAAQLEDMLKQVGELTARAEAAERDRDHFQERYIRTLADYQNSQKRAVLNEREARAQGVKGVVLNILTVLDHFDLALGVDAGKASAQQVVDGVRVIRDELMKVLAGQGVAIVSPQPNDEFDPQRHQAVMQEDAPGVEPGRIVRTLQPGYALEDRLVRPAMVAVRPTGA